SAQAGAVEVRHGVTVHHPRYFVVPKIGMLLTPGALFRSAWRCMKRLQAEGALFDVIDAHYLYPDAVAAARLAQKAKLPFVATARGSDVTQIGLMSKPRALIVKALRLASHIITVSENLRLDLIGMGASAGKISTLRNGVDLHRFKDVGHANIKEMLDIKGDVLLFAGWLIPRKRLDLVLRVTQLLPEITTIVVGDGLLDAMCRQKAQDLGIGNRVHFVGQKQPEDMPAYYSAADLLFLPSDREGWANVLLEAMACGTPVVARKVGGAPDLVTEKVAGRIVDSEDPAALAQAISEVLREKPDRKSVRDFATKFDWDETSVAQRAIFEQAIKSFAMEPKVNE
ncbi:MAG: glycosyltransferase, partial [Kordiimonadaceae bacterium]|nr:glycosyltransferase [Kordiimonadaceae bacterium]